LPILKKSDNGRPAGRHASALKVEMRMCNCNLFVLARPLGAVTQAKPGR
jgi:hypothetical protein